MVRLLRPPALEKLKKRKYFPERRRAIRLRRSHLTDESEAKNFDIKIADSREELSKAFSLIHNVYVSLGLMDPHPSGMRIDIFNALPQTKTFIARYKGEVAGTATLIFDSPLGLPSDEIYKEELDELRAEGRKLSEGSGLALSSDFRKGNLFMYVYKIVFAYAQYANVDDICIAINPKHSQFYEEILLFEPIGELKYYPKVKGAPAILERIDLRTVDEKFRETYSMQEFDCDLYTFFFTAHKGNPVEWSKKYPLNGMIMTPKDLHYFFTEKTDIFKQASEQVMAYIRSCYPNYHFQEILN
ncbi:MAG TPA: hypothetical protein EYP21_07685 [Syntrophaceae bacterium]|nr:hypothetical protein [Syntrophaceae bacterium]